MACYLTVSAVAVECEGCTAALAPGVVAFTDEVDGCKLVAQCLRCLAGLDPRLAAAWQAIPDRGIMAMLGKLPPVEYV